MEGDEDDEQSDTDESIDIIDINPNVKFLPTTVDGLADRFNQLFKEFMRQGKHEHRNEQDGINRDEYAQFFLCILCTIKQYAR